MIAPRSDRDGIETSANAVQELLLLNTLKWTLQFFLIQASAAARTFAALVHILRPKSIRRDLRKQKVSVNGLEARLEDAVGEEELDVKLTRDSASCTTANEPTSLLQQFIQSVGGLVGKATIFVATQVKGADLELSAESDIVVCKEMCAYRRKRHG